MKNLILGPANELHSGIHGSLLSNPPRGIRYQARGASHLFLLRKRTRLLEPLSPHRYMHVGEWVDFGPGVEPVHASRFPVLSRSAWVVDLDDFGYPLLAGRFCWNPQFRLLFEQRNRSFMELVRLRARTMITSYSHPSCRAILFRTERGRQRAHQWIRYLRISQGGDDFMRKTMVLYPAQRVVPLAKVRRKWGEVPLTVLFCGTDFWVKNGQLTLQIWRRLVQRFPRVRFIYVGAIPAANHHRLRGVSERIRHFPSLPRKRLLSLFENSHILFHPTRNESFGMVYLEAMASGMAIVSACGPRLEHVPEILSPEGASLVDRARTPPKNERLEFERCLETLLANRKVAQAMGYRNYEEAATGKFSLQRRNQELRTIYEKMRPVGPSLRAEEIPFFKRTVPFAMRSEAIHQDWLEFRREIGMKGVNIYFR